MKNSMMKRLVALCSCCGIATTCAFAVQTVEKNIQVYYTGIKLVVDGVQITPKDANGSTVEPFTYNGATYLPVRAVGDAIGKQVRWDGNTQTVYIGDDLGQSVFLMDACPPYETSGYSDETFEMGGQTYGHGFCLSSTDGYALFNLNGRYTTLEFDIGHMDGYRMKEGIYEIFLDGQLVKTISMDAEDRVQHISIPLNYALQMKIQGAFSEVYYDIYYGFANITLK